MARIIHDVAAWMIADFLQKHFKRQAVMQIFCRVDFVSDIDAFAIIGIEDRPPALC